MFIQSQPAKDSNVQKLTVRIPNYSWFSRLAPPFTHQYWIQKSSFGKTCNVMPRKRTSCHFGH